LANGSRKRLVKRREHPLPHRGTTSLCIPEICKDRDGDRVTLFLTVTAVKSETLPAGFAPAPAAPSLLVRPAPPAKVQAMVGNSKPPAREEGVQKPPAKKRRTAAPSADSKTVTADPAPPATNAPRRGAAFVAEAIAKQGKATDAGTEAANQVWASKAPDRPQVTEVKPKRAEEQAAPRQAMTMEPPKDPRLHRLPKGSLSVAQVGALARGGLEQLELEEPASGSKAAPSKGSASKASVVAKAASVPPQTAPLDSKSYLQQWQHFGSKAVTAGAQQYPQSAQQWQWGSQVWPSAWPPTNISAEEQMKQQIYMMYQIYNPAKLSDFGRIMAKYKGSEKKLLAALMLKYASPGGQEMLPPAAERLADKRRGRMEATSELDDAPEERTHRGRGRATWQRQSAS